MGKYYPEYDTRIIDDKGWIYEEDGRLWESFDSGDRLFWIDISDEFSISGSIIHIPTKDDYRWFSRNVKKKKLTPYIKIRTFNLKEKKVTGVCRISIYNPRYITGYNENLILTKEMIDILIDQLNSTTIRKTMTKWQRCIKCVNSFYYSKRCKYAVPWGLKIPDYYKLLNEE